MELFLPAMWHDHDIAGQYYDVRVICILVYAVTLYNSFQITSVYYVGHWTDFGPLNNTGRDVQHRRCEATIPRTVPSLREKVDQPIVYSIRNVKQINLLK